MVGCGERLVNCGLTHCPVNTFHLINLKRKGQNEEEAHFIMLALRHIFRFLELLGDLFSEEEKGEKLMNQIDFKDREPLGEEWESKHKKIVSFVLVKLAWLWVLMLSLVWQIQLTEHLQCFSAWFLLSSLLFFHKISFSSYSIFFLASKCFYFFMLNKIDNYRINIQNICFSKSVVCVSLKQDKSFAKCILFSLDSFSVLRHFSHSKGIPAVFN